MRSLKDSKTDGADQVCIRKNDLSLMLFSSGHGSSRSFNTAQPQTMASLGYVVMTIVSSMETLLRRRIVHTDSSAESPLKCNICRVYIV